MNRLHTQFYTQGEVTEIAKHLLGKKLCTNLGGKYASAIIVETEAYSGRNDKACHANNGRRTPRNEAMYQEGGITYVYFCYGIHYMLNIVTNVEGLADAVLIRAVEPLEGIDHMLERKSTTKPSRITSGPGNVCKSMGINLLHNKMNLMGDKIWLELGIEVKPEEIVAKPRIGVDYAGEDALLPWRYYIKGNEWVSKK